MVGKKSLKKNMLMNVVYTSLNFVFPLFTYTYVARVLTPAGTGKVAFANSILSYFSYIATLGIPAYGLRECAKVRDDKEKFSHIVQELLVLNLLSTAAAYIFLISSIMFVPRLRNYKVLFIVMSTSLLLKTIGLEWVYQALEEYSYITIRSLLFKCISVVLTFILIRSQEDYVWYGFLSIFTSSASYICNLWNIRKYVSFKKSGRYNLKIHFKPIMTFFASSIIVTVYANFDVSMIGFVSTDEVGLYNAALKIETIILSVSTSITSVIIPRMTYHLQNHDSGEIRELITKSIRVSIILALPLAVYIFIFAQNVIVFVCGNLYTAAKGTLRVLMICIVPLIFTNLFGRQILIPSGDEKRYSQSVFVGLLINLGLNILLIPLWGAYGAALGTLVTEIWNVYWMSGGNAKQYRGMVLEKVSWGIYIISLISAGISSLIVFLFIQGFSVFWQLVFTTVLFFGVYYFMLFLFKEPMLCNQVGMVLSRIKKIRKNR